MNWADWWDQFEPHSELSELDHEMIRRYMEAAHARLAEAMAHDQYRVGQPLSFTPPTRLQWFCTQCRWRWYAVREWIAIHVLRVEVYEED